MVRFRAPFWMRFWFLATCTPLAAVWWFATRIRRSLDAGDQSQTNAHHISAPLGSPDWAGARRNEHPAVQQQTDTPGQQGASIGASLMQRLRGRPARSGGMFPRMTRLAMPRTAQLSSAINTRRGTERGDLTGSYQPAEPGSAPSVSSRPTKTALEIRRQRPARWALSVMMSAWPANRRVDCGPCLRTSQDRRIDVPAVTYGYAPK